jgi:Protein of unknown function (DUF4238)
MSAAPENPPTNSPFSTKIKRQWPNLDDESMRSLCMLWDREHQEIIDRMLQISDSHIGPSLHIDSRPHAILEMAKLRLWLGDRIFEAKVAQYGNDIDLARETADVGSPQAFDRRENTAQMCAVHIWEKVVAKLRKRDPLVIDPTAETERRHKKVAKRKPHIRENHFSPVFSNREWAGRDNKVIIYSRTVGDEVTVSHKHYKQWGYEKELYSDRLEEYLGMVDDDGASSTRKLLNFEPLTELDKRRWIAFLAIQHLRTPEMLASISGRLKPLISTISPGYPNTVAGLKAAFETLFTNNSLYAGFHRLIAPKAWSLLKAGDSDSFLRSDNPVLIGGSAQNGTWSLLYPLTPRVVFSASPELGKGYTADFVPYRDITSHEVATINRHFAQSAFKSVIGLTSHDSPIVRHLLTEHLCKSKRHPPPDLKDFWGGLV